MNLPEKSNETTSREHEIKDQLKDLDFDPIKTLVEATQAAEGLMGDPNQTGFAISLVQKGSKMLLDEMKEARKLESSKKGNTYIMVPTGFDDQGNAIFDQKLIDG